MELVGVREKLKSGMPTDGLFVFVGDPKCGKTTLAASFPNSYVLELEPGGADRVRGRIHDIKTLADFREALKAVIAEPTIKTIVIDTLDALSDLIEDEIAKKNGLENISERKKGVDGFEIWAEYRQKIESLVGYLKASGKIVILLAHTREPKLDAQGNYAVPKGINIPGKSGPFVAGQAEVIGYLYKRQMGQGTEYWITFQGGPLGTWGSRVDELNDKTLLLPRENPYSAIIGVFPEPTNGHKEHKSKKEKVAA